jgi:hypothetical protein
MFSRMLIGVPTPIKYLGLSLVKFHTHHFIAYISSAGSPTDKPPMAFPCWLELAYILLIVVNLYRYLLVQYKKSLLVPVLKRERV